MDISVSGLFKSFGEKTVLKDLNITFPEHEITCIMGPSGCGKTTLLNILMGLISPDKGTVKGVPQLKSAVFQEDRLCENFNAISNVGMVCPKKFDKGIILSHLESVGLRDSSNLPVKELSGGMKRRVAIVRALLAPSHILFLDEPFKGLDKETKSKIIQYVQKNINGRTVIMVTHDLEEVEMFNAKLLKMDLLGNIHN